MIRQAKDLLAEFSLTKTNSNDATANPIHTLSHASFGRQNGSSGINIILQAEAELGSHNRGYLNYGFRFPPPGPDGL